MRAALPSIAWDVDDVLNDLMRVWLDSWWRPAHPGCQINYESVTENPPYHLLAASKDEYLDSLDAFRQREYGRLTPVREVRGWFEAHGDRFRHHAMTAVPLTCAPVSAGWVLTHFGRWVRSFHFVPSDRPGDESPRYDRNKGEFLSYLGSVDILVDDNPDQVAAARAGGVAAVLFPRPWNGAARPVAAALDELLSLAGHAA